MKWLVQEFLNNASNVIRVSNTLEKNHIDYLLVRVNKDKTLSVIDKENKIPLNNSDEIIKSFIDDDYVTIYGSKALSDIAIDMGLEPGSFSNENFEFEMFKNYIGNDLLNNDFIVGELSNLKPIADKFFIRPTGNTKLFTGMSVTREEFAEWQERENNFESPYIGQELIIAPLRTIKAEYRFFVVDQKVITGSSYKVNALHDISLNPSFEIIEYTKRMVDKLPLSKAFVIDIAETDNGLKVIEYNNINTSGLYNCDEEAIVKAINKLYI